MFIVCCLLFVVCCLLWWNLGFGIWNLEFGIWELGLEALDLFILKLCYGKIESCVLSKGGTGKGVFNP